MKCVYILKVDNNNEDDRHHNPTISSATLSNWFRNKFRLQGKHFSGYFKRSKWVPKQNLRHEKDKKNAFCAKQKLALFAISAKFIHVLQIQILYRILKVFICWKT